MQEIHDFLTHIIHDMRQPAHAIKSASILLPELSELTEEQKHLVALIQKNITTILTLHEEMSNWLNAKIDQES